MRVVARFRSEEEGQTLAEFGLIVALVAVVCIAFVVLIGAGILGFYELVQDAL
jgi:pilus assembly protein Flp/PilA